PTGYLEMLGDRLDRIAPETLVVSEKILGEHEEMPETFRYRGTTGYEVASSIDRVFVSPEGFETLDRAFAETSGLQSGFASVARGAKIRVIRDLFRGELNNFTRRFGALTSGDRHAKDLPLSALEESLVQFIASLTVYRTYIRENEIQERDREILDRAVSDAKGLTDEESVRGGLDFLHRVLRLDTDDESQRREWLRFVMRFQQFTGPVTAKGMEDTALYVYTPLTSLNEVGSEPVLPPDPVAELHELNLRRLSITPRTLSATSTHDTKRGEDTRCRIDVLSEVPGEWLRNFSAWTSRYASIDTGQGSAPSDAEKWFLLQSVIGTWPTSDDERESFEGRIAEYVPKALREAKVHSHWTEINESWEQATIDWITGVISDSTFQKEMTEMQKVVAFFGMINSLAMTILKIISPGIPDIYQGSEMWNLSLVDPDNRRPVDFTRRHEALAGIEESSGDDSRFDQLLSDLRESWKDGRIKLFTTWRSLAARRSDPELFMSGDYIPLEVQGSHSSHVVAFARRTGGRWAVTVVPMLSVTLCDGAPTFPLGEKIWNDTAVILRDDAPARWTSWMSGGTVESQDGRLLVSHALSQLPVALLTSADQR
ncbi:MAG: malto-oligosyltrehalose synthase, partial [Acidobacteria bacterium]|nr:malto-oligosyltrehalose synthase [Acidobacteriota bacterium]